jgi:hypothetical protein
MSMSVNELNQQEERKVNFTDYEVRKPIVHCYMFSIILST